MFGGFDGEFYNDLNIMNIESLSEEAFKIQNIIKSTKDHDFFKMINDEKSSDIILKITDSCHFK
jgi:hypothetical protein